jgi:hypothetical protein
VANDDGDGVCWLIIGRLDVLPVWEATCFRSDARARAFGDSMRRDVIDTLLSQSR